MAHWTFLFNLLLFQVAFGLTVFAITRHYYTQDEAPVSTSQGAKSQAIGEWPKSNMESDLEQLISSFPGQSMSNDPTIISAQADEHFVNQQFDRAADLYQQLLDIDPQNVDTYNNLGITLHYLGRSTEALGILNEGVVVDPNYQRIWLTLGFVSSQAGNNIQARSALTKAVQLGADTEVGQSAEEMLRALGAG